MHELPFPPLSHFCFNAHVELSTCFHFHLRLRRAPEEKASSVLQLRFRGSAQMRSLSLTLRATPACARRGKPRQVRSRLASRRCSTESCICTVGRSKETLNGSFLAVSKPTFASEHYFENSRRDLHNTLLCSPLQSQFVFVFSN